MISLLHSRFLSSGLDGSIVNREKETTKAKIDSKKSTLSAYCRTEICPFMIFSSHPCVRISWTTG